MILSQKRETRSDIFDELYLRNNVLQQALSRFLSSLVLFYIYICVCVCLHVYISLLMMSSMTMVFHVVSRTFLLKCAFLRSLFFLFVLVHEFFVSFSSSSSSSSSVCAFVVISLMMMMMIN